MTSRLLIAAVAVGCVSAAGVGGYLAVRTATHTSAAAPIAATESLPAPAAPAATVADTPLPASPAPAAVTAPTPTVSRTPSRQPAAPRQVTQPVAVPAAEAPRPAPQLTVEQAELPEQSLAPLPSAPLPDPEFQASASEPAAPVVFAPEFAEIELPSNTVIGIRLDTTISSETAQVEDVVRARATRAVIVDGMTVIPTGARLTGAVVLVERGGKIRERARIAIRFTSLDLHDNVRVPIRTETIYREGDPPAGEATSKIGASAVVGSILGGVFGGKRGAVIGGAAGAAGGTAIVVAGDRNEATLASGTPLTVRLQEAATFEVER